MSNLNSKHARCDAICYRNPRSESCNNDSVTPLNTLQCISARLRTSIEWRNIYGKYQKMTNGYELTRYAFFRVNHGSYTILNVGYIMLGLLQVNSDYLIKLLPGQYRYSNSSYQTPSINTRLSFNDIFAYNCGYLIVRWHWPTYIHFFTLIKTTCIPWQYSLA